MIPTTGSLCCKYNSTDRQSEGKKKSKLNDRRESKKREGITKSQEK